MGDEKKCACKTEKLECKTQQAKHSKRIAESRQKSEDPMEGFWRCPVHPDFKPHHGRKDMHERKIGHCDAPRCGELMCWHTKTCNGRSKCKCADVQTVAAHSSNRKNRKRRSHKPTRGKKSYIKPRRLATFPDCPVCEGSGKSSSWFIRQPCANCYGIGKVRD